MWEEQEEWERGRLNTEEGETRRMLYVRAAQHQKVSIWGHTPTLTAAQHSDPPVLCRPPSPEKAALGMVHSRKGGGVTGRASMLSWVGLGMFGFAGVGSDRVGFFGQVASCVWLEWVKSGWIGLT